MRKDLSIREGDQHIDWSASVQNMFAFLGVIVWLLLESKVISASRQKNLEKNDQFRLEDKTKGISKNALNHWSQWITRIWRLLEPDFAPVAPVAAAFQCPGLWHRMEHQQVALPGAVLRVIYYITSIESYWIYWILLVQDVVWNQSAHVCLHGIPMHSMYLCRIANSTFLKKNVLPVLTL